MKSREERIKDASKELRRLLTIGSFDQIQMTDKGRDLTVAQLVEKLLEAADHEPEPPTSGGDLKYGHLYTEAEVQALINAGFEIGVLRKTGAQSSYPTIEDAIFKDDGRNFDEGKPRFPADEPLFLLRGQDKLAAGTISHYYVCSFEYSDAQPSNNVRHAIEAFEQFAKDNPDRMKWSD